MDDAAFVRRAEAGDDLLRVLDGLALRNRAVVQTPAQLLAFEQLRDDKRRAVVRADVINGQNVRMIERGCRPRLLLETLHPLRIGREIGRENLERDPAVQPPVFGEVDLAHAAGADL